MAAAAANVSLGDLLSIAGFIVLAIVASTQIGRIWRGEVDALAEPSPTNRSLPAWFITAWLMIVAVGPSVYVLTRTGPVPWWAGWLALISLTAVAVSMCLASLVWLTGRPRWLVPPGMRND